MTVFEFTVYCRQGQTLLLTLVQERLRLKNCRVEITWVMLQVPLIEIRLNRIDWLSTCKHDIKRYTQRPPRTFYFRRYLRRASFSLLMIVSRFTFFSVVFTFFSCSIFKKEFSFHFHVCRVHQTWNFPFFLFLSILLSIFILKCCNNFGIRRNFLPTHHRCRYSHSALCFTNIARKSSSLDPQKLLRHFGNFLIVFLNKLLETRAPFRVNQRTRKHK